jgi:Protein of unknown function (DUF1573)
MHAFTRFYAFFWLAVLPASHSVLILLNDAKITGVAVQWENTRQHNFGTLAQGQPQEHIFTFRNAGTVPLHIETVRTTCGCTAATWTETTIAPNERGQVTIRYDAERSGQFKRKILVFFKEIRVGSTLRIRGNVE